MILRRLIILAALAAGLAVSAGVVVVGLIHALFVLLEPHLGAAGATALLVGLVSVVMAGAAGALYALSRRKKTEVVVETTPSPVDRVIDVLAETVRERPVVMILAAVGAGVLAIRNPRYLASALRALTAPRDVET